MKVRFTVSLVIILASLAMMAFGLGGGGQSSVIPILDLSELVDAPHKFHEREVRVRGFVKTGSILHHHRDQAEFIMEQEGRELKISYTGETQLPDTFADGVPVRADGQLKTDNTFRSTRIEAKCASKYEAPHASDK